MPMLRYNTLPAWTANSECLETGIRCTEAQIQKRRYLDGNVPSVYLNSNGKVNVNRYDRDNVNDRYGVRSEVIANKSH